MVLSFNHSSFLQQKKLFLFYQGLNSFVVLINIENFVLIPCICFLVTTKYKQNIFSLSFRSKKWVHGLKTKLTLVIGTKIYLTLLTNTSSELFTCLCAPYPFDITYKSMHYVCMVSFPFSFFYYISICMLHFLLYVFEVLNFVLIQIQFTKFCNFSCQKQHGYTFLYVNLRFLFLVLDKHLQNRPNPSKSDGPK